MSLIERVRVVVRDWLMAPSAAERLESKRVDARRRQETRQLSSRFELGLASRLEERRLISLIGISAFRDLKRGDRSPGAGGVR